MLRYIFVSLIVSIQFGFFFLLGMRIIRRDPKNPLNQLYSSSFFLISIGSLIVMIYTQFNNEKWESFTSFLSTLVLFFLILSVGFIFLGSLILYNPKLVKTRLLKFGIIIFYAILGLFIFIFPEGSSIDIMGFHTQSGPQYSLRLIIYLLLVIVPSIIMEMIFLIKIHQAFQVKYFAKKMRIFTFGISSFHLLIAVQLIVGYINIELIRQIFIVFSSIMFILGMIMIWFGIGTQLKYPIEHYIRQTEES